MPAATISIRAPTSCAASLSARSDWYGSIPKDVSPGALAIPRCRAMRPSAAWCASAPPRSSSSARCPILWRLISRPYPQPTSVSPQLRLSHIALPEMIGDLVKRALLPFLSLRKPENPALQIKRGALPAQGFLTANFDQSVHALHSCHVKPFPANQRNRIPNPSSHDFCAYCDAEGTAALPVQCGSLPNNMKPTSSICDRGSGRSS